MHGSKGDDVKEILGAIGQVGAKILTVWLFLLFFFSYAAVIIVHAQTVARPFLPSPLPQSGSPKRSLEERRDLRQGAWELSWSWCIKPF